MHEVQAFESHDGHRADDDEEWKTRHSSLSLVNNQISDVSPLASLTNLTELDLGSNPLSQESIDLHVPNLEARGINVDMDF